MEWTAEHRKRQSGARVGDMYCILPHWGDSDVVLAERFGIVETIQNATCCTFTVFDRRVSWQGCSTLLLSSD